MITKSWQRWIAMKRPQRLPQRQKVAYFVDKEILEIRDLTSLNSVARLALASASFAGRPTNRVSSSNAPRKEIRRSRLDRSSSAHGALSGMTFHLATAAHFHPSRLSFRDFAISPDGRSSPSSLPANAISSSSLFPDAESRSSSPLLALSVSAVISVLIFFFSLFPSFSQNKNPR